MIRLVTLVISVCAFLGCASTTILENGAPVLKTQADMTNVTFQTANGTYFHADVINHSTPTLAGSQAATHIMTGVSGVIGASGAVAIGLKHL